MMAAKDKERIEAEERYITGHVTLRELAKDMGLSLTTVGIWSKEGGWPEKRKAFNRRALKKAVTKASDKRAKELAAMTQASESMERALIKAASLFEVSLENEDGGVFANSKFAARNLESVAEAISKITQNKMLLCGLMEEKDKRKLALEERKLQAQETDGTEITVTLLNAEELSR